MVYKFTVKRIYGGCEDWSPTDELELLIIMVVPSNPICALPTFGGFAFFAGTIVGAAMSAIRRRSTPIEWIGVRRGESLRADLTLLAEHWEV